MWIAAEGGDDGEVYRADDVRLEPSAGLKLLHLPEDFPDTEEKLAHGPRIGCPATMVKGYVRRVHDIAATAALESGLVAVT
jgi:hypothetical protein